MLCTIVIPCYNEAERINKADFTAFIEEHPEIYFLFVNDGSSDRTSEVLQEMCQDHDNASFLELDENCGKAEAVRRGMLHAVSQTASDFAGFWDADLAAPLNELPRMLAAVSKETLYVAGCRLLRLGGNVKRTFLRHLLGRVFATVVAIHLDLPVYDTQCGAKIYASSAVGKIFDRPFVTRWFFDVEVLRRLIAVYGRENVVKNGIEMPLNKWEDVRGSKIRYFSALKDFIKLLCFGR